MGRFIDFFRHPHLTWLGRQRAFHLLLPLLLASAMLAGLSILLTGPVDAAGGYEITKTVSVNLVEVSEVKAGEYFVYTIVVTNVTGNSLGTTITDAIPSGVVVVDRGGATENAGILEWAATVVNAGNSKQVSFTAYATKTGVINNSDYRVSAGQDYFADGSPVSVTIIPNNPVKVLVEANPNPVTVGPAQSTQLTITVADIYGNPVDNSTEVGIDFSKGEISGQPAGSVITGMTTAGQFITTLNVFTEAGTAYITATASGLSTGYAQVVFAPDSANQVNLSATPTTISTDNGQEAVITASLYDQYNNPINNKTVTFTTNLGFLNDSLTTVVQNTVNGQASVRLDGTVAGTATVQAAVAGLPTAQTQVYLAPGVPTQLRFDPPPTQTVPVIADGVSTGTVNLLILDKHGNQVDTPTTVTFTTNLGTLPGGGTTYSTVTPNGNAPVAVTSITRTGTAILRARVYLPGSGTWLSTDRSIDFIPGPPVSVGLTVSPTQIVADGTSTAEIIAYAYDSNLNIVENTLVTFTFASARGTIEGGSTETTTNGQAVRQLRSDTTLGVVPITVTVEGVALPGTDSVEFVVGPPALVRIAAATTQTTVANSVPLTFTVYDGFGAGYGHIIPNISITIGTPIGTIQPGQTATTDGSGMVYRSITSTQAGVASLTVTSFNGVVPVGGQTAITYVADVPSLAQLETSAAQIVADGEATALITVTVTDKYGNPVAGVSPAVTTTVGTLQGSGVTNAAGQTTRSLKSTTELTTATVSVTSLTATPIQVQFVTGPAYSATLQATPDTAYVNLTYVSPNFVTMVITVTDKVGHPITGRTPAVTVYVNGTLAQVSSCTTTNSQGRMSCILRSTKSGTATVYVDGIIATGDTITFNPGTQAAYIVVSPTGTIGNPVHVVAGQPTAFTAVAQDDYRNVIPNTTFTWLLRGGSNPATAGTGVIDVNGVVTGEQSGQMVIEVSSNRGGYIANYIEIDPGQADKANLTISPKTLGIGSYADLTLQVTDSFYNPIDYVYCPTVQTTLGSLTMNCTSPSTGIALGRITSLTKTGTANISVLNLNEVTGDSTVVFQAGPPAKFKATAASTSMHANGTSSTVVTFTIQDNYSNPVVSGYTMYSLSSTLGTLSCPNKTTNSNGQVICTLTAPTTEGTASFSVRYKVSQSLLNNGSDTVNFFIGQLNHLVIDPAGPLTTTAGTTTTLQVKAYDVGNALIPTSRLNYDWYIIIFANGGSGQYTPLPTINDSSATFMGENEGLIETRVLVAQKSDGFAIAPAAVRFTIVGAPPHEGEILVTPDHVLADGATPFTITLAALQDGYGNQASDGDTVSVTLGLPGGPQVAGGIINNGQATIMLTTTTTAGTYPITATNSAGQIINLTGSPWVTFTPGAPTQAHLLTVTPPQIVADGSSIANITLQVQDRFSNNVASGWSLTFDSSLGTISPGGTTDASGQVTAALQAGLVLGDAVITVTRALSSFVATGNVPLVAGPPVSATVAASSTTLMAGGNSTVLHINVYDAWHHPVDGAVITPSLSPALGWFGGSTTAIDGLVTQLLSPFTQTGVATLSLQGLTVTGDLTYTVEPNVPSLALVLATPSILTVGETSTFSITISDAYGNIVPSTPITIASVLGGDLDGQPGPITRTSATGTGYIGLTLTSTEAGTETLSMVGPDGPLNLHPASRFAIYQPDQMIVVTLNYTQPVTWVAGEPVRLVASSLDKFGNVIDPWTPFTYLWEQTSSVDKPGYGQFDAVDSYNRSVDFVPFKVGQNQLRAFNGTYASPYLNVTVLAGAPKNALIGSQTPSVVADNVSTTTIELSNMTDAYGNEVLDGHVITVTVDTRVVTGLVTGGTARLILTATKKAGTFPIQAVSSAGSINLTGFPTVTFRPGPATRAVVKASQKIIKIDTLTATLTITAYDKYSNLVSNGTIITASVTNASVGGNNVPTTNGRTVRSITPVALGTGTISLQGQNGSLFITGDTKVTFISGDPKFAALTAAETAIIANGISSTQLSFSLKDSLHFPVGSVGTAVITVSRGTVIPTTTTVADGQFQAVLFSEIAVGAVDIDVSFNGVPMIVEGDTVSFVPGPAYRAVLTATPKSVQINTADKSTLQFSLFDEWDNQAANGTVVTFVSSIGSVTPTVATSSGNLVTTTFSPGTMAGTAVFTLTAAGNSSPLLLSGDTVTVLPGSVNRIAVFPTVPVWVTAGSSVAFSAIGYDLYDNVASHGPFNWGLVYGSGGGLLKNGVFTGTLAGTLGVQAYTGTVYSPEKAVTVLPGPLYSAMVSATPLTVPIGGVPSQLHITLRDKYGNYVANNTAASVTTNLGTLQGSGTTVNGVLTRTILSAQFSGRAQIYVNGKAAGGDTIFFAPRAWVNGTPDTLLADGISPSEVRVRMLDGDGQPTATIPKTITTTLGTLDQNSCSTGTDFVYVCTLIASNQVGVARIFVDGFQAEGAITFTAGTASVAYIAVEPAYVTTHGFSTATLTITVKDSLGHILTDYNQPLTVSTSLGTLSGAQPTVNGVTQRVLTGDAAAGWATLQVAGLTVSGTKQVEIVEPRLNIVSSVPFLTADGQNAAKLTLSLQRPDGQVITRANAPISVTTSLGTLTGSNPLVNGVTQRTLTAGTVAGTATFAVEDVPTITGVKSLPIYGAVVHVTASPPAVPADGLSQVLLKFTLQDIYGKTLSSSSLPLTVTTSLGSLSGYADTINGVAYRVLTAADAAGMAEISVDGLPLTGDFKVQFVGRDFLDGGFENGLTDWVVGRESNPVTATLVYSASALGGDVIGGIVIAPSQVGAASGSQMARLGATLPNNTSHALSEVWLKQSLYISPTGITQASFWYRLLSYDVKVGSADAYKVYDPFEVYINTQKVLEDGYEWSYEWQDWYDGDPNDPSSSPPPSPKDMGWKQGVLDLTPYAGQIISLEFRVPNREVPVDNTWVYLDDISVVHLEGTSTEAVHHVYLPVILR